MEIREILQTFSEYIEAGPRYYRRDGTQYPKGIEGMIAWGNDSEDRDNKIVRLQTLMDGRELSTVWLGLDHAWGFKPRKPLIFETALFNPFNNDSGYPECDILARYSTEQEALEGHQYFADSYNGQYNLLMVAVMLIGYAIVWFL